MIFTSASDAIVTVDEGQRIMMFNRAAEQLFGCSAGEAAGDAAGRGWVEAGDAGGVGAAWRSALCSPTQTMAVSPAGQAANALACTI